MKILIILQFTLLLASQSAYSRMYSCVDENGSFSFSDKPCQAVPKKVEGEVSLFKANLLIVKSHSDIESWVILDPDKRNGDVGRLRKVKKGDKIYVPIVATFTKSQVGSRIALVADIEFTTPNGQVHRIPNCCLANRVDPRAPTTIVLEPVMDITFDTRDPTGEYIVKAILNDGRTSVVSEEKFALEE